MDHPKIRLNAVEERIRVWKVGLAQQTVDGCTESPVLAGITFPTTCMPALGVPQAKTE